MKHLILSFLAGSLLFLTSCEKQPGEGGTSSIVGKVQVIEVDASSGEIEGEYWAMDEDVFIIYGENDQTYDDKVSCSYDGSYRFDNLTPGKYTLFTYSDCDTCPGLKTAVKTVVDIVDNKTEYTAPNLVRYE